MEVFLIAETPNFYTVTHTEVRLQTPPKISTALGPTLNVVITSAVIKMKYSGENTLNSMVF